MVKADYDVMILPADNGIVVKIGCKALVFTEGNIDEFLADLKNYLVGDRKAKAGVEKKYFHDPEREIIDGLRNDRVHATGSGEAQCAREEVPPPTYVGRSL